MPPVSKSKETKFVAAMKKTRREILDKHKLSGVPLCTPQQAANYLLLFAIPDWLEKIKGICYYGLKEKVLLKHPQTIFYSENGDGYFSPLNKPLHNSLQAALKILTEIGIPIKECTQSIADAFKKNDGYFKWIFFSFEKERFKNAPDTEKRGVSLDLHLSTVNPGVSSFHLIGVQRDEVYSVGAFLHEIGHALGLTHFPPTFGDFDAECAPDFYDKIDQIRKALQDNRCSAYRLHSQEMISVMLCTWGEYNFSKTNFSLPVCDQIAFKQRYDEMTKNSDHQKPNNKNAKPRPSKLELLRKGDSHILLKGCPLPPTSTEIAHTSAVQGIQMGFMRGLSNVVEEGLIKNGYSRFKSRMIGGGIFYGSYFMYRWSEASQNNDDTDAHFPLLEAGIDTLLLAFSSLILQQCSFALQYIGNKLQQVGWKITGSLMSVASCLVGCSEYAYLGMRDLLVNEVFSVTPYVELMAHTVPSMVAGSHIQYETQKIINRVGNKFGFFKKTDKSDAFQGNRNLVTDISSDNAKPYKL